MNIVAPKSSGMFAVLFRVRVGDFFFTPEGTLGRERNASTWRKYSDAERVARVYGGVVEDARRVIEDD